MPSSDDLARVKSRVSAAVLKLPGVAGVGLPAQGVTIYLESDAPEIRSRVEHALHALQLAVPVHCQVSGKFGRSGA